ncbi:extracellular solute-binding protein [Leucobacter aridicollis]|uniref:extracellular solute-binding protein n=1 Tax=Leucobacter aridicollis TaxID=283878 RepID=UPI002107804B|nr:extracellular solute-binding protein [Leucobacter aridicollis]UTX53024.1 extracellular solute-binding protein [Leucobacter aridicollis]
MKRKKFAQAAAIGITAALAFTACSSGPSGDSGGDAGGDTKITFLTHWGPEQVTMLKDAAAEFATDHPGISVDVQAVPFGNLLSTLRTQGASADGPTITGIYDLWLPELVRDGLADAAPEAAAAEVTANWPENLIAAASSDGKVYGVPNEVDLYQLNRNTALFDAAGVDGAPETWDDLVADAKKLTTDDQQGIGFITGWGSGAIHPFLSLLASNGGTFLNEDGTASALTEPAAIETAELYEQLVKDKLTDPAKSTANANTTGPYLDNFTNGKTGMIIMANWWESALKDSMGEKFANVATSPIPVGPSGTKSSSISYSWMTTVNAKASDEKRAAAWEFLTWLNGADSGEAGSSAMADILLSMGILPSRASDLEANAAKLDTPFLSSYVGALEDATPFPTVIGGQAAADALQKQIEALLNGQVTGEEAMTKAAADVDAALEKAQK